MFSLNIFISICHWIGKRLLIVAVIPIHYMMKCVPSCPTWSPDQPPKSAMKSHHHPLPSIESESSDEFLPPTPTPKPKLPQERSQSQRENPAQIRASRTTSEDSASRNTVTDEQSLPMPKLPIIKGNEGWTADTKLESEVERTAAAFLDLVGDAFKATSKDLPAETLARQAFTIDEASVQDMKSHVFKTDRGAVLLAGFKLLSIATR